MLVCAEYTSITSQLSNEGRMQKLPSGSTTIVYTINTKSTGCRSKLDKVHVGGTSLQCDSVVLHFRMIYIKDQILSYEIIRGIFGWKR